MSTRVRADGEAVVQALHEANAQYRDESTGQQWNDRYRAADQQAPESQEAMNLMDRSSPHTHYAGDLRSPSPFGPHNA
jgi:hypothetical protein